MGIGNSASATTGGQQGVDASTGFRPVTAPIPAPDTGQVAPYLGPTQQPTQPAPPAAAPPPGFMAGALGAANAQNASPATVSPADFMINQPAPAQTQATALGQSQHPTIRGAISSALSRLPVAAHGAGAGAGGVGSAAGASSTGDAASIPTGEGGGTNDNPALAAARVRNYGAGGGNRAQHRIY